VALIIHVDGGARGNPGPAGAGVVIRTDDGRRIHEAGYFLGRQTNNAAEYHALIRALQRAQRTGDTNLSICSDSELLVRQLTGEYRVKARGLQPLFEQAQRLLLHFRWQVRHVRRGQNSRADQLANLAMDQGQDVLVFDADPKCRPPPVPDAAAQVADRPPAGEPPTTQATPGLRPPTIPPAAGQRRVQVRVVRQPAEGECPAGGVGAQEFQVGAGLPAGLCLHAAHALLPTVLALQNTNAGDFAAVPTLTIRCTRGGCGATFHVSPLRAGNGQTHIESD